MQGKKQEDSVKSQLDKQGVIIAGQGVEYAQ